MRASTTEALELGRVLFNEGKFFDAHEQWERAWANESGDDKLLLQALIVVAAGCHKATRNEPRGTVKLLRSALKRLAALESRLGGLALDALHDDVRQTHAAAEAWEQGAGPPVVPAFKLVRE